MKWALIILLGLSIASLALQKDKRPDDENATEPSRERKEES